jgi:hypothetical protein
MAPSQSLSDVFLQWLGREASSDSIDVLLFFGDPDRRLQRLASDPERSFVRSVYLAMDTAAVILAETHLPTLVDELLRLVSKADGRSIGDFFAEFAIPLPSAKFLHDIGLPENTVVDRSRQNLFKRFLYAYRWEIFKICRERRRELFQHFLRSGISNGMRVGIVDLGWCAEMQIALHGALDAMFEVQTYAYCFCLADNIDALALRSAIRTRAMVSTDTFANSIVQMVFENREAFEMLFAGLAQEVPNLPSAVQQSLAASAATCS